MRFAIVVALGLLAVFARDAAAATKMRDGFATLLATDGVSLIPRNPVTQAHGGDDVYYWIQWKEPVPRSVLRCVVTGPDTDIDETQNFAEAEGEGFSVCGMETEDSDAGTFVFKQYLDGELVGEKSIVLEKEPFFGKLSLRRKFKWMMGGLGLVLLGGYWVRRKATGDTRSFKEVMGGEPDPRKAAGALRIGARVAAAQAMETAPAPVAPPADEAEVLRKAGLQYRALMAQPDKSKALEAGRAYIGQLLKARDAAEAAKVFKECVAADGAFRLAPEQVLPVARAARAAGDPQAAVAAVRGFDKANPGHALIPEVYVFSARLMAEDLDNAAMARRILQHVVEKYPGHHVAPEAKRYLQAMPETPANPA